LTHRGAILLKGWRFQSVPGVTDYSDAYLSSLQQGGFSSPRRGKNNDKAHPPIHPTAHAGILQGNEKKVYEFITRRFLACCSKDAEGSMTTVDVTCGGEAFYATGRECRLLTERFD
jgi:DNA topoisomerase-3